MFQALIVLKTEMKDGQVWEETSSSPLFSLNISDLEITG